MTPWIIGVLALAAICVSAWALCRIGRRNPPTNGGRDEHYGP